jgi:fatty acid desaturase
MNGYGWAAVLRNVIPFLILLALSPHAPWLLAPLIGLFIYRMTIVMHDCVHRTLFESAALNVCVGRVLGGITGIAFHSFAAQHLRHHRTYGEPGDPQGFQYLGLKGMTRAQFAWHLAKPLLGFNLRYALKESLLNLRRVRTADFALFAAMQALILTLVTGAGTSWWLAPLPFVSAATFGLFFSQLRGIAEHAAIGEAREKGNVRSHAPRWLDRVFLYDLNFNYHAEHHRHPHVPSRRLPMLDHDALAPGMCSTIRSIATT